MDVVRDSAALLYVRTRGLKYEEKRMSAQAKTKMNTSTYNM